jgi:hypothetical protein
MKQYYNKILMKQLILILLIALSVGVNAQEVGYMPGYVVTNEYDTIKGLIKNKNLVPYRVLENIKFKLDEKSKPVIYSPDQLKAFTIGEDRYISGKHNYFDVEKQDFMKVIIEGPLSLYKLEITGFGAGNVSNYSVMEKHGEWLNFNNAGDLTFNFKKEITRYLSDAPALCDKINKGVYKRKHIETIVKEFNAMHQSRDLD